MHIVKLDKTTLTNANNTGSFVLTNDGVTSTTLTGFTNATNIT